MVPAQQVVPIKVDADDDDLLQLVPCLLLSDVDKYANERLAATKVFWQKNELNISTVRINLPGISIPRSIA